ncbi:host cell division inhibitor Icd-like protein [Haemophilus influenzae]
MQPIKLGINMKLIHKHYSNDENFYNLNPLQSAVKFGIISLQSQKTIAEPANSTYLQLAQSTPKACFFMRNIRTPKEFADFVFIDQIYKSLSMVACSGKGSPFAVFQLSQFCRPLHVTAKACKLYAVTLKCLQLELRKMYQFIFALIRAPQIKIRLLADTEQQARSRFTDGDTLLFVGRINQNPLKNNRTSLTDGNNHSLPVVHKVAIISSQSEKVIASRGKLNYLHQAQSTPKACFFMRNIRTPKEYADFVFNLNPIILSMVERNEQSLTGCPPDVAVFHLVTFYRPTVESLAVVPINQHQELTQMYQFIFAAIRAPQIKIRLLADTEQQARSRFTDGDTLLFVGRINQNPLKNNRTSLTDGNNHSLPKCEDVGSIENTITRKGNRNPYQCGIFLPKIHSLHVPEKSGALSYIEFAVRLRDRNKALSTNQIRSFRGVVETVSHPMGDTSKNTKHGNPTMKIYPKNNRTLAARFPLSVNNHSLPKCEDVGSIESTTTQNGGNRSRYQCGFFIPQIPFSYVPEKLGALSQAEFVARSIRRNKAEFIRTNKASNHPFSVVVEPLSHLTTGYGNLFTNKLNGNPTMKIYPKNNRTLAVLPTLSVSAAQGGANV